MVKCYVINGCEYYIGDKVKIPTTKNAGYGGIGSSCVIKMAREESQPFLYFNGYDSDDSSVIILATYKDDDGDFFSESDLRGKYVENKLGW